MTDIITYAAPFDFIGKIAESLFIENKVKDIFDYRETIIKELFGSI